MGLHHVHLNGSGGRRRLRVLERCTATATQTAHRRQQRRTATTESDATHAQQTSENATNDGPDDHTNRSVIDGGRACRDATTGQQ
jgi:hypothetical protein